MKENLEKELAWEILENCPYAVEILEPDGRIVYINKAAAQRYGRSVNELLGACIWDQYSLPQARHRKAIINKVVRSGLPVQFTDRMGEQWVNVSIYPLSVTQGSVDNVIIYTHDVTQKILAEERLKLAYLQLFTSQEEERRKIAQDLHDDIGQSMIALLLNLKSMQSEIATGRREISDYIKETIHFVEDMMRHIRQVLYELRTPSFDTMSLSKVLKEQCAAMELATGLRIVFSSQEQMPPIPSAQATVLYRLVQEGMNNAVKHAKATSVWINLEYVEGEVNISVEDDGQGFDPAVRTSYGLGLQGLRERFLMLGGNFDVESAPGKGTRLFGSLPLINTQANPANDTMSTGQYS
jgi:two-component system sensor histidine kinase UhpB